MHTEFGTIKPSVVFSVERNEESFIENDKLVIWCCIVQLWITLFLFVVVGLDVG